MIQKKWEFHADSVLFGLAVGVVALGLFGWLTIALIPSGGAVSATVGTVAFFVYLVVSLVFAMRMGTTMFGAGLLLAIGAWLLIGAGLCFAILAGAGR